ncbi:MAG TPA: NAD(P)/FAD-dependent oxidoreductase [Mesorhizobium sp.]|jgi:phytoene dehydrogenase-like protein|nr:NAD(P)/FAD-dependent oxidoreductase [Mesorhizobium sp.]
MTSSEAFDAVVIGAGHNGLVAASVLAKAGRKVVLVEAEAEPGGAARGETFAEGFRSPGLAHVLNRLHPEVIAALDLKSHGLAFGEPAPTAVLDRDNGPLILHGGYGEEVEGLSAGEAAAWGELRARLFRQAGVLKPFLVRNPPALGRLSHGDKAFLGSVLLSLRRLGREEMREFLRMVLMNVHDVAEEHLSDDRLKGLLAFDATLGVHLGPRSPTSLLGLYYRLAGEAAGAPGGQVVPRGGMGAVIAALVRSAESAGVALRTKAEVRRILVGDGAASGVALADGTELRTGLVLSAINPKTTFFELVGAPHLDIGFMRKVGNIRMNGAAAKLHLALDGIPAFAGLGEEHLRGRIVIAPSSDGVERAYNPSKYGDFSREPVVEVTLPGLADPALAPQGGAVLSAVVQFVPYRLRGGWTEARKAELLEASLALLERHAPGLRRLVRAAELLTPADIERRYHMPGGHWHHGELQADAMLFSRPVAGSSGYGTPVEGLYLCGAGAHPGGGISGLPGLNAARAAIRDGESRKRTSFGFSILKRSLSEARP